MQRKASELAQCLLREVPGLTEKHIGYHESDLYVVAIPGVREWLNQNYKYASNITEFIGSGSPDEWEGTGKTCLDIPFAGFGVGPGQNHQILNKPHTTRLVFDVVNGRKWQWKYLQNSPGMVNNWFDYGPAFDVKYEAVEWGQKEGLTDIQMGVEYLTEEFHNRRGNEMFFRGASTRAKGENPDWGDDRDFADGRYWASRAMEVAGWYGKNPWPKTAEESPAPELWRIVDALAHGTEIPPKSN